VLWLEVLGFNFAASSYVFLQKPPQYTASG